MCLCVHRCAKRRCQSTKLITVPLNIHVTAGLSMNVHKNSFTCHVNDNKRLSLTDLILDSQSSNDERENWKTVCLWKPRVETTRPPTRHIFAYTWLQKQPVWKQFKVTMAIIISHKSDASSDQTRKWLAALTTCHNIELRCLRMIQFTKYDWAVARCNTEEKHVIAADATKPLLSHDRQTPPDRPNLPFSTATSVSCVDSAQSHLAMHTGRRAQRTQTNDNPS